MMQQVKLGLLLCILVNAFQYSNTVSSGYKTERCACITGPPDYKCPSATLLQVYLQHDDFCTRYYKCVDGKAMEFQCPPGLYFDLKSKLCQPTFTLCYREPPCFQFADNCRCCRSVFDNTGLAPQNFYVCYNDGSALAVTCPEAFDPCTNSTIQLQFINQKCEVPPGTTPYTTTTTKKPYGSGSGSGSGSGYPPASGSGSGSGYPPASGSGSGSGYPPASGSGSGSGYPPASGSGSGSGYPPASGSGSGSGYAPASGSGSGSGYGSGAKPGSGSGYGSGSGSGSGSGYKPPS